MTLWTFDLRSSDSDIEDEEDISSNTTPHVSSDPPIALNTSLHPQQPNDQANQHNRTAKELDELFGVEKEEDDINYRPNPWSIAKMHANTRASSGATRVKRKNQVTKTSKAAARNTRPFATNNLWSKNGFVPQAKADREKHGIATQFTQVVKSNTAINTRVKPVHSLRDSISAVLRRGMLAAPTTPPIGRDEGNPALTPKKTGWATTREYFRREPQDTSESAYPIPVSKTLLSKSHEQVLRGERDEGAYIPSNNTTISQVNNTLIRDGEKFGDGEILTYTLLNSSMIPSHPPTAQYVMPTSDPYDRNTPAPTPGCPNKSDLIPPSSEMDSIPTTGSLREAGSARAISQQRQLPSTDTGLGRSFSLVPLPKIGSVYPMVIPTGFEGEKDFNWILQDERSLDSSCLVQSPEHELSPTLQLIAKFAAPAPPVLDERMTPEAMEPEGIDSCGANYHDGSPIFAWEPPSPDSKEAFSDSYSMAERVENKVYLFHTPERRNVNSKYSEHNNTPTSLGNSTAQWRPITPQSKTPKKFPMPTRRFDPDNAPFWSTLQTPQSIKQNRPSKEVKSARFRLPGAFLANTPLKLQGKTTHTRTLYKPPARKRTRSREDDPPATVWKLTRIT